MTQAIEDKGLRLSDVRRKHAACREEDTFSIMIQEIETSRLSSLDSLKKMRMFTESGPTDTDAQTL